MLISIIVPVYNVSMYLEQCLNSLLNQSYEEIEIILVNDGSTDNSLEICKKYAREHSSIVVVSQTNQGLSVARNTGIDKAIGEYIMFVDSDDWIEPDTIKCMSEICEMGEYDVVIGGFCYDYYGSRIVRKPNESKSLSRVDTIRKMLEGMEFNHSASGKLYKKELFEETRFPSGKYFEDYFTIYYIIDKTRNNYMLDKAVYHYRIHSGTITTSKKSVLEKANHYYEASCEISSFVRTRYPENEKVSIIKAINDNYQIVKMLCDYKETTVYKRSKNFINGISVWTLVRHKMPISMIIRNVVFSFSDNIYIKLICLREKR